MGCINVIAPVLIPFKMFIEIFWRASFSRCHSIRIGVFRFCSDDYPTVFGDQCTFLLNTHKNLNLHFLTFSPSCTGTHIVSVYSLSFLAYCIDANVPLLPLKPKNMNNVLNGVENSMTKHTRHISFWMFVFVWCEKSFLLSHHCTSILMVFEWHGLQLKVIVNCCRS